MKLKLALVWLLGLESIEVITGGGGAVPLIVHEKVAAVLKLPAASWAWTENVWVL